MPETPTPSTDLNRAIRDAKKQAGEVSDAAQDLYSQTVDSASHCALFDVGASSMSGSGHFTGLCPERGGRITRRGMLRQSMRPSP
jgi:hypothetical protein